MAHLVLSRGLFDDPFGYGFGYHSPYCRPLANPNPFYGMLRRDPVGYRRFNPYGYDAYDEYDGYGLWGNACRSPRSSLFLIHRAADEETPSKESEKTVTEKPQEEMEQERSEDEETKKQVGRLGHFGFDLGLPIVTRTDEGDHYMYDVSVPSNVQKDDLDLSLRGSYMILKGTQKEEKSEETEDGIQFQTSSYSSWSRVLSVPKDVSHEAIEAHFEDGHLKIHLGKHMSDDKMVGRMEAKQEEEEEEENMMEGVCAGVEDEDEEASVVSVVEVDEE
jgi:HSP20 family protein